jgi:Ser/Thr protein kinase RdoA (MazF antagonist)
MNANDDAPKSALDRAVEGLIGRYAFSRDARVSLLSESENRVYRVREPARAEDYVVRVNSGRLGYHTPPAIASELTWMMALRRDTDIAVPEVLAAEDGTLVQSLAGPGLDQPRHAAVYGFLSGSARMHRHAQGWTPPDAFTRCSWTPETILDDRLNWGPWQAGRDVEGEALDLLSRVDLTLRERLAALPRDRAHFGLIHADLRLANLLVDGERTAIIDFDDCGFGWYLFDLAAALSFLEERPDAPELIDRWLNGYRTVADVPAAIEREIPSLVMLRRLQLIGWVGYQQHRIAFAREIGPRFTAESCRLAEDYLGRFG